MILIEKIIETYKRLRLFQYRNVFSRIKEKAGSLSATEAYALDVIYILDCPTIKQFSDFLHISQPNASYKVANLIAKGYITKEMSEDDRREYHLKVTEKFYNYYGSTESYITPAVRRLEAKYSAPQLELFGHMLDDLTSGL